jgi:hypothetical protein
VVLVFSKPVMLIGCIAALMHILQAGRVRNPLPCMEKLMTTVDFIIAFFSQVDNHLHDLPKHPQAPWGPSEGVTRGLAACPARRGQPCSRTCIALPSSV